MPRPYMWFPYVLLLQLFVGNNYFLWPDQLGHAGIVHTLFLSFI